MVEIEAGMVWHTAGSIENLQQIAEAASDYWRLYLRLQSNFEQFGHLQKCSFIHATHKLTLTPCGVDMVFITITNTSTHLEWLSWEKRIQQLSSLLIA